MAITDWFRNRAPDNPPVKEEAASGESKAEDIFKAYIPNFLYKPPFGMPRRVNTPQLKELAKNPYVFSVIKTLCDEATSIGWEIKVKKEFQEVNMTKEDDEGKELEEGEEGETGIDLDEKQKEITKFFDNPNGNEESFNHLLRQLITDICEVDSGVLVKIFNQAGEFQQLFARDGSLFLKNPDIYGYMGNRREFVAPLPDGFTGVGMDVGGTPTVTQQQIMKQYSLLFKEDAAYFQYGWTAGSLPVPFGKREICYVMQNPRGDSIYGRSPVEVLMNTILNLIYGIDFNLDFYTNNNMPSGAIQLLGAQQAQIAQFRENFENNFRFEDEFGKKRKKFFKFPISSSKVEFTPFQMNAKEMDIIAQQEWFTKILWMSFGVNADEMGFTESSNKAVGAEQIKVFKRKAIKPLLQVIQYHINTQIMPEFFAKKRINMVGELPKFSDVPLEFTFDMYDIDEDNRELDKLQKELTMGIKTSEMIAKERGINLEELKSSKADAQAEAMENMSQENKVNGGSDEDQPSEEDKKYKEEFMNNKKNVEEKGGPGSGKLGHRTAKKPSSSKKEEFDPDTDFREGDKVDIDENYGGGSGKIDSFSPSGWYATVTLEDGTKEIYSTADLKLKSRPVEEKAIEDMTPVKKIENHIDNLGREIVKQLEIINEDEIKRAY